MRPEARVQAAIEVVDLWRRDGEGLDRVLAAWGRAHRFAGGGDRRAIADLVYDAVRRQRSALWVVGAGDEWTGRDLLQGSLLLDGADPATFFTGSTHAPAPLSGTEPIRDPRDAPRVVRLDVPDWLSGEVEGVSEAALASLRARGEVHLRVNLLKTDLATARTALAAEDIAAEEVPTVPTALRVTAGARRVARSRAYLDGLVEIQDAASQAVAALAEAAPGERVLDVCAGGGGKTLALAADMANRGALWAYDANPRRMADLPARARRAGATIEIADRERLDQLKGTLDLVFVDAPCSGSGAWRRNPDAKWRLDRARLDALRETQAGLLDQAAALCAPAGRICYATCSILPSENRDQVAAFLSRRPGWRLMREAVLGPEQGWDGFYGTILTR